MHPNAFKMQDESVHAALRFCVTSFNYTENHRENEYLRNRNLYFNIPFFLHSKYIAYTLS